MDRNLEERQVRIKSESFEAVYEAMEAHGFPESMVGGVINAILTKCSGFWGLPVTPEEVKQLLRKGVLDSSASSSPSADTSDWEPEESEPPRFSSPPPMRSALDEF